MMLARVEIGAEPPPPQPAVTFESHPEPAFAGDGYTEAPGMAMGAAVATATLGAPLRAAVDPADPATWVHSPRNAPCPCGSGRKYKHCHGRNA